MPLSTRRSFTRRTPRDLFGCPRAPKFDGALVPRILLDRGQRHHFHLPVRKLVNGPGRCAPPSSLVHLADHDVANTENGSPGRRSANSAELASLIDRPNLRALPLQ
jgi:hypothetical protein